MTNKERIEQAARKMLQLVQGALKELVTFQKVVMPNGSTVFAICFGEDKWELTEKGLKLKD
jgi:hypothetical protein